mmetsp:Transcript_3837/g.7362  ORF Transcript_3837/g.7362 Transcript_3837/m.7362 type:complete len:120 (-) Transcript_3837:1465-1824(-)
MYSTYRVNYQLRAHRRDPLIELIKSLLNSPFLMLGKDDEVGRRSHFREVFRSLENLVKEHMEHTVSGKPRVSKLQEFVPAIGVFFTDLKLCAAFEYVIKPSTTYRARFSLTSRHMRSLR